MNYHHFFKSILLFLAVSFLSVSAWAYYNNNLTGTWYHDGQAARIQRIGFGQYLFCNEHVDCAKGILTNDRDIQVFNWSVTGRLNKNYEKIKWSNGTQWTRYSNYRININGRWFHNGQPTQIQVNGNRFSLTNEMGQTDWGYIQGNTLKLSSLNITGFISQDNQQIRWSNNTVWSRYQ